MESALTPAILTNGFRKCGLVPWDPAVITIPGKEEKMKDNTKRILFLKRGLDFLEKQMHVATLDAFQSTCGAWTGDIVHESLFYMWKKTLDELENLEKKERSAEGKSPNEELQYPLAMSCLLTEPTDVAPVSLDVHAVVMPETIPEKATTDTFAVVTTESDLLNESTDIAPIVLDSAAVVSGGDAVLIMEPDDTADVSLQTLPNAALTNLPGPSSTSAVPSPFKKHFFYVPTEVSKDTKRKPKETLPTIAFGEDYQIYMKRKMEKKENLAKLKLERASERKRKKEEKDALMEQKKLEREDRKRRKSQVSDTKAKQIRRKLSYSSDSSDSIVEVTSGESDIDDEETDEDNSGSKLIPPKKVNGEFVIVRYDGKFYPGLVVTALPSVASISAMARVGRLWKWPVRPDVCEYKWENVVTSIKEPQKTSKTRELFNVPEMFHFED